MNGEQLTGKFSVNLLQPELLPEQPSVTLNRMVLVWGLVLIAMLAWDQYSLHVFKVSEQRLATLNVTHKNNTALLADLQVEIQNRKKDAALEAKLATLKLVMRNKQALHARLTDPKQTYVAGFANSMTELSKYHHKDISLQQVVIEQNEMLFAGLAKNPEAVPQWLSGFEQSELLSGKHFKNFQLTENENKITAFTIGSTFESKLKKSVN